MKDKIDSVQETLKDRYKLLGVLGEGGMSVVFKAQDLRLNSLVAIKVLHQDPEGLGAARLQREAQTSARLSCINVARVFNFGQTQDGTPYMVMEMLDGIGLDKLIKDKGRLDYTEAVPIFKQICNGLKAAHNHEIVHRDLKPSNILLIKTKDSWQVKILDFGIAQIETDQKLTRTGALLGSPSYMSPEQIENSNVDIRTDIYSFGCLMFETLSGQTPFKGSTSLETLAMHKNVAPPLISEIANNVPPPLAELLDKCLQKLPERRPQNVAEIEAVLNEIENDGSDKGTAAENIVDTGVSKKTVPLSSIILPVLVLSLGTCAYFGFQVFNAQKEAIKIKDSTPKSIEQNEPKLPPRIGSQECKFKAYGDPLNPSKGLSVVGGADIEDNDLQSLYLENIESLKINSKELTGSGLKYLKGLKITRLELKDTNITSDNLKYLADLKNLSELILHSPHLDDEALEAISYIKNLTHLSLDAGTFSDKGFANLAKLEKLSAITLINLKFTDKDLKPLSRIKSLTTVRIIDCTNVSPDIGVTIAELHKLETVFINHPLSNASYKALARTKMIAFNLKNRIITPKEFDDICSVKSLWRIGFIHAHVTDDNYSDLLTLPHLARFEISRTEKISDSLISTLSKSNIRYLDISFSGLRQDQLEKLLSVKSLEQIWCTNCTYLSGKQLEEFRKLFEAKHHKPLQLMKSAI